MSEMNGSSEVTSPTQQDPERSGVWPRASGPLGPQSIQACPCLPELERVKFRAWLLAHCGLWLGQNICLLLWLPYT